MEHSFDIRVAGRCGVPAAILYRHFQFWIAKNNANGTNCHEERTWTYNSVRAYADLFPYLSVWDIRQALQKLVDEGVLIRGSFNMRGADRTKWYAFADEKAALAGLPDHLQTSPTAEEAGQAASDEGRPFVRSANGFVESTQRYQISNPNPRTADKDKTIGKRSQDVLGLDCRIKRKADCLADQLEQLWPTTSKRERTTFANILRYFIASAQADPEKLSWFTDAAGWARTARLEGKKAGGKALFVAAVKERTGYGGRPLLLAAAGRSNVAARASPSRR